MKKILLLVALSVTALFIYATQIEVVGEVFASYTG